jgi:hypothetical protein
MGDQLKRMAPPEIPERPIAGPPSLKLDVEHPRDAVGVHLVRPLATRVTLRPGLRVCADQLRGASCLMVVGPLDCRLRLVLPGEDARVAVGAVPLRVARDPALLPGRVYSLEGPRGGVCSCGPLLASIGEVSVYITRINPGSALDVVEGMRPEASIERTVRSLIARYWASPWE